MKMLATNASAVLTLGRARDEMRSNHAHELVFAESRRHPQARATGELRRFVHELLVALVCVERSHAHVEETRRGYRTVDFSADNPVDDAVANVAKRRAVNHISLLQVAGFFCNSPSRGHCCFASRGNPITYGPGRISPLLVLATFAHSTRNPAQYFPFVTFVLFDYACFISNENGTCTGSHPTMGPNGLPFSLGPSGGQRGRAHTA